MVNEMVVQALARAKRACRFDRREWAAIGVLVFLLVCGATLAYVRARPASAEPLAPVMATPETSEASGVSVVPPGTIVVHVVGRVRKPGVYEFPDGARVNDAIEKAGGFAPKADRAGINLARPLVDGEQIVVARSGTRPASAPGGSAPGGADAQGQKVNINTATSEQFETLPGIGPALAQRILTYREQHGSFRSVADLQKVSGIGPKKFEAIQPLVTV